VSQKWCARSIARTSTCVLTRSHSKIHKYVRTNSFAFKDSLEYGIWNVIYLFSSNRYLNLLSTISFSIDLNPRDGLLAVVDILHKTLYVLKLHTN